MRDVFVSGTGARRRDDANLVLVLVDQRTVDVSVSVTDGALDLRAQFFDRMSVGCKYDKIVVRTAFSTSFGLDNHVPKPICGIFAPVERVICFPKDMSSDEETDRRLRKVGGDLQKWRGQQVEAGGFYTSCGGCKCRRREWRAAGPNKTRVAAVSFSLPGS